jgi:predicted alpha/beta-hydrolase family hydrolase
VEHVTLGGHSYGGRQASLLAAEAPNLVEALLLLSYPLHPPKKPGQWRTAHFPKLQTPALFVSGTKDEFGTVDELRSAIASFQLRPICKSLKAPVTISRRGPLM